jgi:hypothetical protein
MSTTLADQEGTGILREVCEHLEDAGVTVSSVDGRAELLSQAQRADVGTVLLCEDDVLRAESARVYLAPGTRLVVFSTDPLVLPRNPSTLVVSGRWLDRIPEIAKFIKGSTIS